MNKTNIEWVKNPDGSQGYTWNPITGCLNHDDGLCKGGGFPCYACKLANGRLKERYLANPNIAPIKDWRDTPAENIYEEEVAIRAYSERFVIATKDPFYPHFWEERLEELTKWINYTTQDQAFLGIKEGRAKGIFVCDMGDLFGIGIPELWTRQVLSIIRHQSNSQHRFYLLTKQPQNLIKFSPFPENCWVGVTATNGIAYREAIKALHNITIKVKYISFEPLLQPCGVTDLGIGALDWLIIGACTGSRQEMIELYHRSGTSPTQLASLDNGKCSLQPRIEWVREIVEAADKAGIPVFLKDNLKPIIDYPITNPFLFAPNQWDLRQEMPK